MIKTFQNKLQLFKKLIYIIKSNKEPFIISGGNTIKELFKNLNTKITNTILLSDERLVKSNSKIRNSFFFKKLMLKRYILKKNFIYYKSSKVNYKELENINKRIKQIKFKFAILSLGSSGHLASIFKLNKERFDFYLINNSPKFPKSRVTVSLKKIKKCNKIIIIASKKNKINEIKNFYKNPLIKFLGYKKTILYVY